MRTYSVKEGSTGILELTDENGKKLIFQPDYDLDKTKDLLYEFYNHETDTELTVKNSFNFDDIDWFPTTVSRLYWHYFYPCVKYRTLLGDYLSGSVKFIFDKNSKYHGFKELIDQIELRDSQTIFRKFSKAIQRLLIPIRNKIVTSNNGDILLYSYTLDDFRTREIRKEISNNYKVTYVTTIPTKKLLKYFFNNKYFITANFYSENLYSIELLDKSSPIFNGAIAFTNKIVSEHVSNYKIYQKTLKKDYKLFLGIDDANWVYPILYASQDLGIKTLGFQHGAYQLRHQAYFLTGIKYYRWYENVVVWGDHWKRVITNNSKLFDDQFHIVGSNKHQYDYSIINSNRDNKSILIPYEFSSDTMEIGIYMKKFIDSGYDIFFKPRVDDPLQDQIDSYMLGDYEDKISILKTISPENMRKIDIVAGTFTTLLYELLPYNKPVWILETSMKLSYDMVDEGFARLFKKKDFQEVDQIFLEDITKEIRINRKELFGDKALSSILDKYIIEGS